MIDNVILIITGTLHERDTHELLDRCHPLGAFDTMPALCVATTVAELYNTVLVETPLGNSKKNDRSFFLKNINAIFCFFLLISTLFCQLS
jgi:vacuolar-type H+-ATPase subunit C/Vma6